MCSSDLRKRFPGRCPETPCSEWLSNSSGLVPVMSLILQDVKKSYREPGGSVLPILNIARFELADGEQMALLGPSGGGKTTLLNVISGITSPDSGSVTIDGVDIARLHEVGRDRFRARKIGFVFQTFNLLQIGRAHV